MLATSASADSHPLVAPRRGEPPGPTLRYGPPTPPEHILREGEETAHGIPHVSSVAADVVISNGVKAVMSTALKPADD